MGETAVDPGDIEDFAKRVRELAKYWHDPDGYAVKLAKLEEGDYGYPQLGEFKERESFTNPYETKYGPMMQAFSSLNDLLDGLADASNEIAKKYRNAEELNQADLAVIDSVLGENMAAKPQQPGSQPPSDPRA